MTDEATGLMEIALEKHAEWLNMWHEHLDEGHRVVRGAYDEYDDPPRVLEDVIVGGSGWRELRVLFIYANPYHDEGGSAILTAFFERWDEKGEWQLADMVQEFDTMRDFIVQQGKVVGPTSKKEVN